ncbi:dihydroorotase [Candidatus Falkowbacteria bacterium]|nr:dihydroorotase [Candidatus Falkowbacteria bacterium]
MADTITLRRFFDAHVHFRQEWLLALMLSFISRYARYGVAMPNTRPAILTAQNVVRYRELIQQVFVTQPIQPAFEPLMTIEIRDNTTPEMVVAAFEAGAVAGKVYPLGTTTNSDEGLRDFFSPSIGETFRAMEEIGMLLLIHGELDGERVLVTEREHVFLPTLPLLHQSFPGLKIVLEHVSTKEGIEMVEQLGENVAATLTPHHLCTTLNDAIGYGVRPHNVWMPISKGFDDLDALLAAATSGKGYCFLGSDIAAHRIGDKECAVGKTGGFTGSLVPSLLMKIFKEQGCLDKIDGFASGFGPRFYGLDPIVETMEMVRELCVVEEQYGEGDNVVVPFMAGQEFEWQLAA